MSGTRERTNTGRALAAALAMLVWMMGAWGCSSNKGGATDGGGGAQDAGRDVAPPSDAAGGGGTGGGADAAATDVAPDAAGGAGGAGARDGGDAAAGADAADAAPGGPAIAGCAAVALPAGIALAGVWIGSAGEVWVAGSGGFVGRRTPDAAGGVWSWCRPGPATTWPLVSRWGRRPCRPRTLVAI